MFQAGLIPASLDFMLTGIQLPVQGKRAPQVEAKVSVQTPVQGSGCINRDRMQSHCILPCPTPRLSGCRQRIPNMSSAWAEMQVEVKIGELLMAEGKESMC